MKQRSVMVCLENVGMVRRDREGKETEILADISFTARPAEITAIVGPSGGGKSSLVRLVNRLEEPTSGRITLAGMIIGNSMNGASLAAERLSSEIGERREEIETALCLGATSRQASETAVRAAFRAALIPTLNTMAATGIVSLPGMMTGQILSGTEPVVAVRYQIAIMCAITGAVAITSFLILLQGYRHYFTAAHQLKGN